MADTSPRLPSTPTADATPYAPYAVLAIAAVGVAASFAVLLLVLTSMAFFSKQRIVEPMLLAFPAVALVLTYAGRRQVLNSEGTRDGLFLCTLAWWLAILCGCGYAAYLAAIQFSIKSDTTRGFNDWAKNLKEVDLSDPKNLAFYRVFVGSNEPEKQANFKPNDVDSMWKLQRTPAAALRQSDVVQVANRNRGALDIEVTGMESWEQDQTGLKARISVRFKCAEGEFETRFSMIGKNVGGEQKWGVVVNPGGNFLGAGVRVTPYGQRVHDVTFAGYYFVQQAFLPALEGRAELSTLIDTFAQPQQATYPFNANVLARLAGIGALAYLRPEPPGYMEKVAAFFSPVDKGDPVREAEQRRSFLTAWRSGIIAPAKRIMTMNPDSDPILNVKPDYLELKVPVEIGTPGNEAAQSAARGHVVLRLDDPATLREFNKLREEAPAGPLAEMQMRTPPPGSVPWKIVRIESDMKMVTDRQQSGPGGPGGGAPGM